MLSISSSRSLLTSPLSIRRPLHSLSSTTTRSITRVKMTTMPSSTTTTQQTTIEHIVLFKVKPAADPNAMLSGLASLSSLPMVSHLSVGPILSCRSPPSLSFTHLLHSRYPSKDALAQYSAHQAHMDVVRQSVLPICDDLMAVDWVAQEGFPGPTQLGPGSAVRAQFVKLKEGLGEREGGEILGVLAGLGEVVKGIQQLSCGENFSPARAKGFSIGSLGVLSGPEQLAAIDGDLAIEKEKDKVREYIDSLIIVDYVVPSSSSQSSSL